MTQYRQGDVFVKSCNQDISGMKQEKRDDGKTILAWGEVTGHHHRFEEEHVKMFTANDNSGKKFIVVTGKPATLFHEEHAPIEVPEGTYKVVIQREWSDDNEPVQVLD